MALNRASHAARCVGAVLLGFLFAPGSQASNQPAPQPASQPALEYQVKAAFVLNFTKFIEWPAGAFAGPDSPFAICILGDDPFGSTLDQIVEGDTVNGRKLIVQRLRQPPPAKSCQLLFIHRLEKDLPAILTGLGPGVLTVGEREDFIRVGGMIRFVVENRRVRFDINLNAATASALTISSKLLTVARSVQK